MIEKIATLPAPVRHLALLLVSVLLSWAGTELLPVLHDQSNLIGSLVAGLLAAVLAVVTPLVNSYGVGKVPEARPTPAGGHDVTTLHDR